MFPVFVAQLVIFAKLSIKVGRKKSFSLFLWLKMKSIPGLFCNIVKYNYISFTIQSLAVF